jgi:23S rRNA (pseudouridine1915-N3)-methyltransferase
MRILIFAFGKLKTPGLRQAADYYLKLTRPWIHVEEIQLKAIPVTDTSASTRLVIQEKEEQLLLGRIDSELAKSRSRATLILMDEDGTNKSTLEWAKDFEKSENQATSALCICIGSSLGFSKSIRKTAPHAISLGQQTLPHELARVVLLEQIYRAYSILKGHPYHNR